MKDNTFKLNIDISFLKNSIHSIFTRGLVAVISFLSNVIITRSILISDRGSLSLSQNIIMILTMILTFGINNSNIFYIATDSKNIKHYFTNSVLFSIAIGVLLFCGASCIHLIHPSIHLELIVGHAHLFAFAICFSLMNMFLKSIFLGLNRITFINRLEGFIKLSIFGIVLILLALKGITWTRILYLLLLENLLATILYLYFYLNEFPLGAFSFALLRKSTKYSLKSFILVLSGFLIIRQDLFLVKHFLDNANAGIYATCGLIAENVSMIPIVIASLLFPKLSAENDFEHKCQMFEKILKIILLISLGLIIIALIGSKLILFIFIPKQIDKALPSLLTLLSSTIFLIISSTYSQFMAAIGLPKNILYFSIFVLLLNFGLNYILIPIYGILGASVSSLISYFLLSICYYMEYQRLIKNNVVK